MPLILALLLLLSFPAQASFEAGQKAYALGDYQAAFTEWQNAADDGDIDAQRNIAHLYRWGKGVSQDLTQAAYWYYTAAKGGSDTAQYNLGIMYLRGEGIPRNEDEGIIWLKRAEELGNKKATQKLAHLKAEIEHELPTEADLLTASKAKVHQKSVSKKTTDIKIMKTSVKEPPSYAHLASYYTQETLEKGWLELKQIYPELAKFTTIETHVTLPAKGKYIRLYIKGKSADITEVCRKLNEKKQYCLISYP